MFARAHKMHKIADDLEFTECGRRAWFAAPIRAHQVHASKLARAPADVTCHKCRDTLAYRQWAGTVYEPKE